MNEETKVIRLSQSEIREILELKNEAFASLLDEPCLEILSKESTVEEFESPCPIVKQHEPSDSLYVILSGRCTVGVNDRVLSHMEAGDIFGEMGVIQNTPRSATIMAIEPTRALRVPGESFKKMLARPKLSTWMINLLTDRLKRCSLDAARTLKEMDEIRLDQMELARVQRSLLPKELPIDPRVRVHVLYSPCAYAGGDYYDVIFLDENRLLLIIADVTGHGAQASISMAIVRSFVHQKKEIQKIKTPGEFLQKLNKYLFEYGPTQHFVTAQVSFVDLASKTIAFAYAGHSPLLHLRDGQCQSLKGPRAFFLRFRTEAEFETTEFQLKSGDRIAYFTDGAIETFNANGDMFNIDGLENFMINTRKEPISSLPSRLETALHRFRDGSPVEDDITFMVLEMM
jgi:serine phosphatase RsbU (regulator of sigma subunit)